MDEQQRAMLDQQLKLKRGAAIIEGTQEQFRQDGGYTNLLNKFGTMQDNSTAYVYNQEPVVDDMQLIRLYEGNGLFAKIIDRPSEEAVKHGLDIDYGNEDIAEYVDDRMDELGFEDKFATAEKWARLYGGSIIVMLIDDGRGLEEPVDWNNVRSIEELRVFERAIVQPDYTTLYNFHFLDTLDTDRPFGEPEYYQVFSIYGYFVVHRTRCLVFRNGRLPEQTTNANYRYWGIPEYVKIKRALRECITSHEDGVKLLERSAQAIYKMKNLANMLATADGENKVLQRLQIIDMARSILNSIAIDTDGEDYTFETLQMSGVKDVLDSTCNMLSAVTNIPQTILFGRSPAGMNSTGDSDMENYYNMVENIQKQNMKKNVRTVIDLILRQGVLEGKIPEEPRYKVKFAALWSLSETEQADVDNKKASTEYTKAQTVQIYMDSNVIDPSEVRKSLASEGSMEIEELLNEEELDISNDTFDFGINDTISISGIDTETDEESDIISIEVDKEMDADKIAEDNGRMLHILTQDLKESEEGIQDRINQEWKNQSDNDTDYPASAVIVIKDGKILCASRRNGEGICGPGGHVEDGESPEEAAVREAMEEFNIVPLNLIPLGEYKGSTGLYLPSMIYFTDTFSGTPEADGDEMMDAQWLSLEDLQKEKLFPPFKESLDLLVHTMKNQLTSDEPKVMIKSTLNDGGPGSGRYPKGSGKSKGSGSQHSNSRSTSKAAYDKALKGIKTSDGKTVKAIDPHVYKRGAERKIYPDTMALALKNGSRRKGNTGNRTVYSYNGTEVVFDNDLLMVKSAIYKGKKAKKGG